MTPDTDQYFIRLTYLMPGFLSDQVQLNDSAENDMVETALNQLEAHKRWLDGLNSDPNHPLFQTRTLTLLTPPATYICQENGVGSFPILSPFADAVIALLAENIGVTGTATEIQYSQEINREIVSRFLDLMRFITGKHSQGYPSRELTPAGDYIWVVYFREDTTGNLFIPQRKDYWEGKRQYDPMIRVYYQPGIGRFSLDKFIRWPNNNIPSVHTHLRMEMVTNPTKQEPLGQGMVIIDFSLQHSYPWLRLNSYPNEIIDLIDLRYGPKKHHIPIAYGPPSECCRFIHSVMATLGFGNLIV